MLRRACPLLLLLLLAGCMEGEKATPLRRATPLGQTAPQRSETGPTVPEHHQALGTERE